MVSAQSAPAVAGPLVHLRLWLVYGMTEAFCLVGLVWFRSGTMGLGQQWGVTAALTLVVYPAAGLLAGLLVARVAGAVRRRAGTGGPAAGVAEAEAVLAGLFLFNAVVRGQYFAVPGAILVLGMACLHATSNGSRRLGSRVARWMRPEAAIAVMVTWAFLLQPRETLAWGPLAAAAMLTAAGAIAAGGMLEWVRSSGHLAGPRHAVAAHPLAATWGAAVLLLAGLGAAYEDGGRRAGSSPARAAAAAQPPGVTRPNVLLITLDTVRADRMSVYGYSRRTTPFLERLVAERATRYTQAYAASNSTLTSHASLFSGLPASATGTSEGVGTRAGRPMAAGLPLLTRALRDAGYTTRAVAANFGFLAPRYGFGRHFDSYLTPRGIQYFTPRRRQFFQQAVADLVAPLLSREGYRTYLPASEINALHAALPAPRPGQPRFDFLNYMDAHWPYLPSPRHRTAFGHGGRARVDWADAAGAQVHFDRGKLSREALEEIGDRYDDAILALDEALESLVEALEANGTFDDTLIVLTSDHGEGLGDNGVLEHRVGVGDEQVRVPLIIKYPGQHAGRTEARLAGGVDIPPTILDVVGVPWPHATHGRSLRAPRSSPDPAPVVVESFGEHLPGAGTPSYPRMGFLTEARFLFEGSDLRWHYRQGWNSLAPGAGRPSDAVAARSYLSSARQWMAAPSPGVSLPAETLERLRSLGYVR